MYKFFEFEFKERQSAAAIVGPREFGITMILIGLTLLVVSSYEYRRDRKAMQKMYPNIPRSTLGVIAGLIAGLESWHSSLQCFDTKAGKPAIFAAGIPIENPRNGTLL